MKLLTKILFGAMIVTILACGGGGGSVDPSITRMAFWGQQGTQNALYITAPGSVTNYEKVTDIGAKATHVRLSPDRSKILWIEGSLINVVNSDGTGKFTFDSSKASNNADWASDSDTIIYQPSAAFQIRKTKVSNHATDDLIFDDVDGLEVTTDGTMMAFVPNGTNAVHYSMVDGSQLNSLPAEPSGTYILNATIDPFHRYLMYVASGMTSKLKVADLETGEVTEVSGTRNVSYGFAIAHANGAPVTPSYTTDGSTFTYTLSSFVSSTDIRDHDTVTGAAISRVVADPTDSFGTVAYTKGTCIFTTSVLTSLAPTQIAPELTQAGYCDWR